MITSSRIFVLLLLFSALSRLGLSPAAYSGDLNNHIGWAQSILRYGSFGAYDRAYTGIMQPTYPPLALHAFVTSTWVYNQVHSLTWFLNRTFPLFPSRLVWAVERQQTLPAANKLIAIFSDLGVGVLIYLFARHLFPVKHWLGLVAAAAYLFNPAVIYTSSIWGQIESFPLFFLLLSFWLLAKRQITLAHLSFAAALLSKQSVILYTPIFLLASFRLSGWKPTLKGLAWQVFLLYTAYSLFLSRLDLFWPVTVYLNRLQTGSGSNYITDHAFNLWSLVTHLAKIPDTSLYYGLSAQLWGTLAFFLPAAALYIIFWRRRLTFRSLFHISTLFPLLAFLLLTRMHERYLAPVLPFLVLGALYNPVLWLVYAAVSFVHLANLYHLWWFPDFPYLVNWLLNWSHIQFLVLLLAGSAVVVCLVSLRPSKFASRRI